MSDPIDGSPPGSPVPGILQARRTLEWVAISFSNAWKWKVKVKLLSHVRLFVTPWTAAYQAPPSMGRKVWHADIVDKLTTQSHTHYSRLAPPMSHSSHILILIPSVRFLRQYVWAWAEVIEWSKIAHIELLYKAYKNESFVFAAHLVPNFSKESILIKNLIWNCRFWGACVFVWSKVRAFVSKVLFDIYK